MKYWNNHPKVTLRQFKVNPIILTFVENDFFFYINRDLIGQFPYDGPLKGFA